MTEIHAGWRLSGLGACPPRGRGVCRQCRMRAAARATVQFAEIVGICGGAESRDQPQARGSSSPDSSESRLPWPTRRPTTFSDSNGKANCMGHGRLPHPAPHAAAPALRTSCSVHGLFERGSQKSDGQSLYHKSSLATQRADQKEHRRHQDEHRDEGRPRYPLKLHVGCPRGEVAADEQQKKQNRANPLAVRHESVQQTPTKRPCS